MCRSMARRCRCWRSDAGSQFWARSVNRATDNPAACYGLFNTVTSRLTYVRVPYDVDVTVRKIVAHGLPQALAERLLTGS